MPEKAVFVSHEKEAYRTWRTSRLFALYLSMQAQERLHIDDQDEELKIQDVLRGTPFPEKCLFYLKLSDPEIKEVYKRKIMQIYN